MLVTVTIKYPYTTTAEFQTVIPLQNNVRIFFPPTKRTSLQYCLNLDWDQGVLFSVLTFLLIYQLLMLPTK